MNFIRLLYFLTWIDATVFGLWGESWGCPSGVPKGHEDLQTTMENKLFGQHIVLKTVPNVIKQHLAKEDPKKALVISFHGNTGIGKTYVTEMIAQYIYGKEGSRSGFVHTFLGDDYGDPRKLQEYKNIIKDSVVKNTKLCGRSLFIFSEIDTMQHGMFDVLKPYVDYSKHVDKVNYRKNIFIFLSNIGGAKITELTLDNINSGAVREAIARNKLEEILSESSLMTGGFEKTHLILSGLVDFFIPFLPLEKFHVKQCILEELSTGDTIDGKRPCGGKLLELMDKVAEEVRYHPPGRNLVAEHGCKMIEKKVDMLF